MHMGGNPQLTLAAILNACWWVRHYRRGKRNQGLSGELRRQAITKLGLTLREALNATESDFEPILRALVDGLDLHDAPPF